MSLSTLVKIGADQVDINKPCDVATALKKVRLRLTSGGLRETVRIDGEEITFQRANDSRLTEMIREYEAECSRQTGGRRRRFAKRVSFS
jgi:hypothetical protein